MSVMTEERGGVRAAANRATVERMFAAEPVLVDVARAEDVVPGMTRRTILTSGPRTPFDEYHGGQRRAILAAAVYEGLAAGEAEAEQRIAAGEILVEPCQEHGCIGSVAGIYTGSMPVLVVKNRDRGNLAFCNLYEGKSPRRLNYGVYDEEVRAGLDFLAEVVGPVLSEAVRAAGGVPLKPLMRRALNMGDELHSRNTAASLLFGRALVPALLEVADRRRDDVLEVLRFMEENEYFFLRLSMAAAKATADAAHGVEGSSVVTGMCLSGRAFAIRVGGLGDEWIRGPLPTSEAKLFDGFTEDDIEWMGGESCTTEAIGLGGFAQATAPALQDYQGGTPAAMQETNLRMYEIAVAENPDYRIPYLGYRGTPTGIDVLAVRERGVLPVIDAGLAGKDGGQIGAGTLVAPAECFEEAARRYHATYPDA